MPSNVAAFRAIGEVDRDDYKNIVIPEFELLVKKQDKINFMLVLDTAMKNFTVGAILSDLAVGLKHFTRWNKMAIVSESGIINHFTDFFSYIAPGKAKGFTHDQLSEAEVWVSS